MPGRSCFAQVDDSSAEQVEDDEVAPQVELSVVFKLFNNVKLNKERIFLGDIAECSGWHATCDEAHGIDLGQSPLPGERRQLLSSDILPILKTELEGVSVAVDGEKIELETESVVVDSDYLKTALTGYLQEKMANSKTLKLEVESIQVPKRVLAPAMEKMLTFTELDQVDFRDESTVARIFSRSHRKWNAEIRFLGDSISFPFYANIGVSQYLPVARKDLERGARLQIDDFIYAWIRAGQHREDAFVNPKQISNIVLTRAVAAGEPVRLSATKKDEIIKRGQNVRVKLVTGDITVMSDAKVLDNAALGENVRVFIQDTKKTLQAMVLANGELEVVL